MAMMCILQSGISPRTVVKISGRVKLDGDDLIISSI